MPSRYSRKSQLRDPYKKIVIASEGNVTEPAYFDALRNNCRSENIKIVILKREPGDTNSAPVRVLGELDSYKKEFGIKSMDELWLVMDKDRWPAEQVSQVVADSATRNYQVALSNPCFEIWLILHIEDLSQLTETSLEKHTNRTMCKTKVGVMKNSRSNAHFYNDIVKSVESAIRNAEKLDINPAARFPNCVGSHVYKLAKSITQNI